jgi:hypothetical protein
MAAKMRGISKMKVIEETAAELLFSYIIIGVKENRNGIRRLSQSIQRNNSIALASSKRNSCKLNMASA